jgi:hypothetical protein
MAERTRRSQQLTAGQEAQGEFSTNYSHNRPAGSPVKYQCTSLTLVNAAAGVAGNAANTSQNLPRTGVQQQQEGRQLDPGSDVLSSQQVQETLQHVIDRQLCDDAPLLQATVE